jgi:2'-5' RNA ligase
MPELVQALHVSFHPFELGFSRCEKWGHGLVVAIPDATPLPMVHLHAELGDALRGVGLHVDEREFRPHLTLARRHFQALPKTAGPRLRWLVDGYVLVESRATPRSEYQVLHRYA